MGGGGGSNQVAETADQVQEQKNNIELWNYYQTSYKPFIDKYINNATADQKSGAQQQHVSGQVNAEVMKGLDQSKGTMGQPNAVGVQKRMDTAASISSQAQTAADAKVTQQQDASLQNIVDIGRGQQTSAMGAQQDIAASSLRSAITDRESELKAQGAEQTMIGNSIGSALGAVAYGAG